MADIKNLKAFCEGLTEDETQFLMRAEFIKLKQLIGPLSPEALVNLQAHLNATDSIDNAHPALRQAVRGGATVAFKDPVLIDQFEEIQKIRENNDRKLSDIEATVLGLALKDPENFTKITGPMSTVAWHLSKLGFGEVQGLIPGQEIEFRPNHQAKAKMQN
jgi:hypothetical protein